ncbi:hypothetical protein FA95DRAFT_1573292 [Auriscalpium vulgare]|uniref:Uncharacterized protein n=1 Tax=Auriscalpium vulgare TaxID=40419 RepID=A0ACB8RPM0_9AGAM|nr:hypothetical protein FA95DRAFT_1573292 [Auriscalpium vulgare]
MHSTTTLAVILLAASAASPAIAAPVNVKQARGVDELMAREPSLIDILKPLGTGLLGGAAIPLLNHFLGDSSSSASSRRDLASIEQSFKDFVDKVTGAGKAAPGLTGIIATREDDELVARSILGSLLGATEDSLGTVLKTSAAGGLASGAVAAAGGALEHLLGDKDSSSKRDLASIEQSFKDFVDKVTGADKAAPGLTGIVETREYDKLVARSILGSLLGATEDSLGTVLKTSAAGGLASGAVAAAGGALEHLFGDKDSSSKRELEERLNLGPIEKGLIGTVTSLGVSGAASDLLGKLFGNSGSSSRRDLEERLNLGPIEKGLIGTVTSLGVSGAASDLLGKLFGNSGSSSRRDLEERLNLGPIEKGLIGTVTSLGVSGAASDLLGKLFGNSDSSSRRDITPEQALAAILLSGRSFDELD